MAKAGNTSTSDGCKEYCVKMADVGSKKLSIMRFKPPHTCDMSKINNPTLERQQMIGEEVMPEYGEGSEFGRKMKEEARRKRKGFRIRKSHPDDQPWVLKEQKKGGKHFVGRKEGGVNRSTSYYLFIPKPDGTCEAFPVANWYDFVPPVQYNYLNDEEAEERFEKRNKTLNYFSIMVSKRIREKEGKETEEAEEKNKSGKKKGNLQLVESDSDEFSSVGSDRDDDEPSTSKKKKKRTLSTTAKRRGPKQKRAEHSDSEAGEDTDEGEMESREMDYLYDTSSDSEEEKVKRAIKDEPRDDAEVERKEEDPIDQVFEESSSDDDDEENEDLTESGKELRALIKKQTESTAEAEEEDEEKSPEKQPSWSAVNTAGKNTATASAQQKSSSSLKHTGIKREAETQLESSSSPAAKRSKADTSTITAHEVRKYLQRRPMMPKQLVKKFVKLKTGMDKQQVVTELGQLLRNMADVDKSNVMGKMHLSLKTDTSTSK